MSDQNNQQQVPSDGGPAFPADFFNGYSGHREETPGMSLRDFFATMNVLPDEALSEKYATALAGERPSLESPSEEHIKWWAKAEAKFRYIYADAMLKAREEGRSETVN